MRGSRSRNDGDPEGRWPGRRWPWGQRALARIATLKALVASERPRIPAISDDRNKLLDQADNHLESAENYVHRARIPFRGAAVDGALANTNEAHTLLLRAVSLDELQGMLPDLVAFIEKYLPDKDNLLLEVDKILDRQIKDRIEHERKRRCKRYPPTLHEHERQTIVDAVDRAYSVQEEDLVKLRSFERLVHRWSTGLIFMVLLLAGVTLAFPSLLPLCFYPPADAGASSIAVPDDFAERKVVCPTREVIPLPTVSSPPVTWPHDIAAVTWDSPWSPWDYAVIELAGMVAAAVTGAATLHRLKDSGSAYNVPFALAVLKLPAGALTAVLGILLMRGEFVPGLSALDTSAQIIAWAVVFGAAQQLFTRIVDHQGASVMELDPTPDSPLPPRDRRPRQPKPPEDTGGSAGSR